MSDEQTGDATENVTAATPDELEALWAWSDAIRWAVDGEARCPCVCHNPVPAS